MQFLQEPKRWIRFHEAEEDGVFWVLLQRNAGDVSQAENAERDQNLGTDQAGQLLDMISARADDVLGVMSGVVTAAKAEHGVGEELPPSPMKLFTVVSSAVPSRLLQKFRQEALRCCCAAGDC